MLLVEATSLARELRQAELKLDQWEKKGCSAKADSESEWDKNSSKTMEEVESEDTQL